MTRYSTLAPWAQWTIGILFSMFTLIAGSASLGLNVWFGAQTSIGTAIIFGLSDCFKIALPAVAVIVGWQTKTRIAYGVAVILSITSAMSFLLETQGNRLLNAQHQAAVVDTASTEIEAIRKDLDGIEESLNSKVLSQLHKEKSEAAEREGNRGFCGPKCEALKDEAAALLARLGSAKRREALEAKLSQATATVEATPKKAIGSVNTLVALTGLGENEVGTGVSLAVAILSLLVLELGAMLSDNAMGLCRSAYLCGKKAKTKTVKAATIETEMKPNREAQIKLKFQLMIWNSPGQQLVSSNRQLAEQFGVAKSTFNDWMIRWKADGEINYNCRGGKTIYTAAKKAA